MPAEIPGFYFDEEKNRYFPNSYKRKREEKEEDVPVEEPKKRKESTLVPRLMLNREVCGWSTPKLSRLVMEASAMHPQIWKYENMFADHARCTAIEQVYSASFGTEGVFTGLSTGDALLHTFSDGANGSEPSPFLPKSSLRWSSKCKPPALMKLWQMIKGTRISAISSSATKESSDKPTIISTLGSESLGGSMTVANLNTFDIRGSLATASTLWTAQCFPCGTKASLGSNKNALIVQLESLTKLCKYNCRSDVLTQTVDSVGDHLLCGLRNGSVLSIDVRERKKKGKIFQLSSSVCSMLLLKDQNYVVASAMNGSIGLWDRRMTNSVVSTYEGQVNTHSMLRLATDPTERLLVSGGEDRAVRIWSLRTGELLRRETGFRNPPSNVIFQHSHDHLWRAWFDAGNSLYCMQGSLLA